MSYRPRLIRSIPFWILLVGSLASVAFGALLVVDKIAIMNTTITDQTATGIEVYGGQAWVTLGAALVGSGLVGLVATLFLAVAASFVPAPAVEVVEPIDWDDTADEVVVDEPVVATTSTPAGAEASAVSDADADELAKR